MSLLNYFLLAGVPGFEPGNTGVKVLCLTAWRYPNSERGYYSTKKTSCQPKKEKKWQEERENFGKRVTRLDRSNKKTYNTFVKEVPDLCGML